MKKKVCLLVILAIVATMSLTGCGKESDYKKAISMYENGQYEEAKKVFLALGDYENSANYVTECDNELMHQKYGDVFDALNSNTWYFNGGSNTILNSIEFTDEVATISQVSFDTHFKYDNGSNDYDYVVDDKNITVTLNDGSELEIAYTLSDGKLTLGKNEYFSIEEIDAGLQGFWTLDNKNSRFPCEYNIQIDNGNIVSESASKSAYSDNGEYFYSGPSVDPTYKGTYTLNFGGFDTDMYQGSSWFYNIIDGKVALLRGDKVCSPSDMDKLPGLNGYTF